MGRKQHKPLDVCFACCFSSLLKREGSLESSFQRRTGRDLADVTDV